MQRTLLSLVFGMAAFVVGIPAVSQAETMCTQVMIDCDEVDCNIDGTEDVCELRAIANYYKAKADESTELSVLCAGIVASVEKYNPSCLKNSFDKEGGKMGPKGKKSNAVRILKNQGGDFSAAK